ncbi:MAG: hypothetical protein EOM52_12750, partial [Clostridia bacterium]|nr:hypothetical protein [Clostridia bacterium]
MNSEFFGHIESIINRLEELARTDRELRGHLRAIMEQGRRLVNALDEEDNRKRAEAERAAFPAGVFSGLKNWIVGRIKRRSSMKDFSWIDFSQKQLLKIRVAVLKIDNKINEIAGKLRQRAEKKRQEEQIAGDNYWQDLKNVVKAGQSASGKKAKSPAAEFRGEDSHNSERPAAGSEG